MNATHGLPSVANVLNGPRSIAARPSSMRERVWTPWQHAHPPASRSVDIEFNGEKPTELWSSVVTRAIHRVEEFTIVLIMAHFAVGMLAILFGW